jgi:hypothetical protein
LCLSLQNKDALPEMANGFLKDKGGQGKNKK